MKTIVVGYDETEGAKRVLTRAAELATAFDATVIVTSRAGADRCGGGTGNRAARSYRSAGAASRGAQAGRCVPGRAGIDAEYSGALGDPATEILKLAESRGADLIVVGTREARLLERLIDPSVSGSVQRRAHCDVLIVH